jgi:hypothetical protein
MHSVKKVSIDQTIIHGLDVPRTGRQRDAHLFTLTGRRKPAIRPATASIAPFACSAFDAGAMIWFPRDRFAIRENGSRGIP